MKLDKIKFASLMMYLTKCGAFTLNERTTAEIDSLIDIEMPVVATNAAVSDVDELLRQIANPDGFISAIEAYRVLTGAGLKEAKEAIERYRVISKFSKERIDAEVAANKKPATLGDIIGHVNDRFNNG